MTEVIALPQRRRRAPKNSLVKPALEIRPAVEEIILPRPPNVVGPNNERNRQRRLRRNANMKGLNQFATNGISTLSKMLARKLNDKGVYSDTVHGSVWLSKVLDPSHPGMDGCTVDVPDRTSANVACAQVTQVDSLTSVSQTGDVFYLGPAATTTTIHTQNDLRTAFEASFETDQLPWNMYMWVDPSVGLIYTAKFAEYDGTSIYVIANTWCLGAVLADLSGYHGVVQLSIISYNKLADFSSPDSSISRMRIVYNGNTVEFSASITTDQGEVVGAQLNPDWRNASVSVLTGLENNFYVWRTPSTTVPTFKNYIAQLPASSPKCYSTTAKQGYYCPSAIADPTFAYLETLNRSSTATPRGVANWYIHPFLSSLAATNVEWSATANATASVVPGCSKNSYWNGFFAFQAQLSSWSGLDPKASFKITSRYGVAMQADAGSTIALFALPSPKHDSKAMDLAIDIRSELDDFYPASYNFLDKLWGIIKKVAKPVIDVAKPYLGAIGGELVGKIPFVGNALRPVVGDLINHIM